MVLLGVAVSLRRLRYVGAVTFLKSFPSVAPRVPLAATDKCLARSNKTSGRAETTKGRPTEVSPAMSNILKAIDLADRAIRRAVFAVLDAAGRANRRGSEPL